MSEDSKEAAKNPMTDEERLQLCKKMDQELDEFIDSLEKKRYTEGWPEDRWEEEMNKHPFFMKNSPNNGELSPLAEGLAKLKYDPDENTPLELATSYKEDGNFNFKHKNYRLAIYAYSEGIRQQCDSAEINASLYNNRAACHYHLKNFRSALLDCEKALSYKSDHAKARLRAANSALQIEKYDKCLEHCEILFMTQGNDKVVQDLLFSAKKKKTLQERDVRKKARINSKNNEQRDGIIKAIVSRGIRISNCEDEDDLDLSTLEPCLPGVQDAIVHIEDGILKWPVLFLYPEYKKTDFVKDCAENVPLLGQVEQLFPAPWDEENNYTCDNINVYFEGYDKMPHVIDPKKNLSDLLLSKYFELKSGTPAFFILPRGSRIESSFLESYI